MVEHKGILKNTGYQLLNKAITAGITFIITLLIASRLGASAYGSFTSVVTYVGFFLVILDFGLNAVFIRERNIHFMTLFITRIFLAGTCYIIALALAFFLPFAKENSLLFQEGVLLFALTLFTQAVLFSVNALIQKYQQYIVLPLISAVGYILTLLSIYIFVNPYNSHLFIYVSFLLGGVVSSFFAIIVTKTPLKGLGYHIQETKALLQEGLPLLLMLFFNLVYFRADILILSSLSSSFEVGVYGLAYKVFEVLISIPLFLSNALYPFIVEYVPSQKKLFLFIRKYILGAAIVGIVIAIGAWFIAPLIALIKNEFVYAVPLLRILVLSLPFFFLSSILQWVLIAQKKMRYLIGVYCITGFFNAVLNSIFIPQYGPLASAVLTGVSEGVVFILLFVKVFTKGKAND